MKEYFLTQPAPLAISTLLEILQDTRLGIKEGVHQFYKFVLKCKVRYTDTNVICDFPQFC